MMKMKNFVWVAISLMLLASCGGQENKRLTAEMDSLKWVIENQNENLHEMTSCLDVVANGLDSIHQQENIIYMGRDEVTGKKLTRQELKQRMKALAELISRQRERIDALEDSLSFKTNKQLKSLKMVIASLNAQLEEKERTIADLKTVVEIQRMSVDSLRKDKAELEGHVQNQEKALKVQDEIINEGYYIIGTRKELKEAGVITGKLLQKSKVNLETADLTKLQKIDIRDFGTELKIDAKKAVILSHMPETSYRMVEGNNQVTLFIEDVNLFWSMSKILVIQTK